MFFSLFHFFYSFSRSLWAQSSAASVTPQSPCDKHLQPSVCSTALRTLCMVCGWLQCLFLFSAGCKYLTVRGFSRFIFSGIINQTAPSFNSLLWNWGQENGCKMGPLHRIPHYCLSQNWVANQKDSVCIIKMQLFKYSSIHTYIHTHTWAQGHKSGRVHPSCLGEGMQGYTQVKWTLLWKGLMRQKCSHSHSHLRTTSSSARPWTVGGSTFHFSFHANSTKVSPLRLSWRGAPPEPEKIITGIEIWLTNQFYSPLPNKTTTTKIHWQSEYISIQIKTFIQPFFQSSCPL